MKKYIAPKVKVIEFNNTDVIMASGAFKDVANVDSEETLSWDAIIELFR